MVMESNSISSHFSDMGIPNDLYWLGPIEGAEMQNGMVYHNGKWLVYYREHGLVLNCEYFSKEDDAILCLEKRLQRLINYYKNQ